MTLLCVLAHLYLLEDKSMLALHHDWGPKGSVFLRGYLEDLVRNELGKQPAITVSDDVVTIYPSEVKTTSLILCFKKRKEKRCHLQFLIYESSV